MRLVEADDMDTRRSLNSIAGRTFDVAIIGAGMNGASAAQQLAAEGYDVLLVDKADFCSGSSSKSGRLLHCGLRYLAPGSSIWEFVRSPGKFQVAAKMASKAMYARSEFVESNPQRAVAYQCAFPVYKRSVYRRWQTEIAFRLLEFLSDRKIPLDYKWHGKGSIDSVPFGRWLRDRDDMLGIATYREYEFNWPERIGVDMALDVERMGSIARNYTMVKRLTREGDLWNLELERAAPDGTGDRVQVRAKRVLNMAGMWIDRVNASAANGARRRIMGTKGIHIMVRLPAECAGYAVHTFNRENEGYSCIPYRGMHSIGPTETLFEGDPDDVKPLDNEIDFLIDETNYIFPSMNLRREHVLFSWAGVRPLGADPDYPKGKRSREIHDLKEDGMPGIYAMTAGPIMTHRSAGREMAELIAGQLKPSKAKHTPDYTGSAASAAWAAAPAPLHLDQVDRDLAKSIGKNEMVVTLADAMFRRLGIAWAPGMGYEEAPALARLIGEGCKWSDERIEAEIASYREHLVSDYRVRPGATVPSVTPTAS